MPRNAIPIPRHSWYGIPSEECHSRCRFRKPGNAIPARNENIPAGNAQECHRGGGGDDPIPTKWNRVEGEGSFYRTGARNHGIRMANSGNKWNRVPNDSFRLPRSSLGNSDSQRLLEGMCWKQRCRPELFHVAYGLRRDCSFSGCQF